MTYFVYLFLPFSALSLGLMHLRQHRKHRWHRHRHRHRHQRKNARNLTDIKLCGTRHTPGQSHCCKRHSRCTGHESRDMEQGHAAPPVSETQLFSTRRWRWAFWHKVRRFIDFDFFDPFVSRALESRVTHKVPKLSINPIESFGPMMTPFVVFKRNEKRLAVGWLWCWRRNTNNTVNNYR